MTCPIATDRRVIAASAAITPARTKWRGCRMERMTAIKKVLSPSSEMVISSKAAVKAVSTGEAPQNQHVEHLSEPGQRANTSPSSHPDVNLVKVSLLKLGA